MYVLLDCSLRNGRLFHLSFEPLCLLQWLASMNAQWMFGEFFKYHWPKKTLQFRKLKKSLWANFSLAHFFKYKYKKSPFWNYKTTQALTMKIQLLKLLIFNSNSTNWGILQIIEAFQTSFLLWIVRQRKDCWFSQAEGASWRDFTSI